MNQMTVTFEWDDDLGLDEVRLERFITTQDHTDKVRIIFEPNAAQAEFERLCRQLDEMNRMTYGKFMSLTAKERQLFNDQYLAMQRYSQTLRAGIEA